MSYQQLFSKLSGIESLLYNHQTGFRKLHSCQTTLTRIVDNLLHAINNKETVGTVFLDLTKAFDLVNHKLLLQKLAAYKFSSNTQLWLMSYLTSRFQQADMGLITFESNHYHYHYIAISLFPLPLPLHTFWKCNHYYYHYYGYVIITITHYF